MNKFTREQLKFCGISPSVLRKDYTVEEMRAADYKAAIMKTNGFTAQELRRGGYSAGDLRTGKYPLREVKGAGYSLSELKEAGFSLYDLNHAGYGIEDLRSAGFQDHQLSALPSYKSERQKELDAIAEKKRLADLAEKKRLFEEAEKRRLAAEAEALRLKLEQEAAAKRAADMAELQRLEAELAESLEKMNKVENIRKAQIEAQNAEKKRLEEEEKERQRQAIEYEESLKRAALIDPRVDKIEKAIAHALVFGDSSFVKPLKELSLQDVLKLLDNISMSEFKPLFQESCITGRVLIEIEAEIDLEECGVPLPEEVGKVFTRELISFQQHGVSSCFLSDLPDDVASNAEESVERISIARNSIVLHSAAQSTAASEAAARYSVSRQSSSKPRMSVSAQLNAESGRNLTATTSIRGAIAPVKPVPSGVKQLKDLTLDDVLQLLDCFDVVGMSEFKNQFENCCITGRVLIEIDSVEDLEECGLTLPHSVASYFMKEVTQYKTQGVNFASLMAAKQPAVAVSPKKPNAFISGTKRTKNSTAPRQLKELTIEDVTLILDTLNLSEYKEEFVSNNITGRVLCEIENGLELNECGLSLLPSAAEDLFSSVQFYKANGVPASIFL